MVTSLKLLWLCAVLGAQVLGLRQGNVEREQAPGFCGYGLTLDANWRWVHHDPGYENCFDGAWRCSDCSNCVLEGVGAEKYQNTYGVRSRGPCDLELDFVTGSNVGSRLYVLEGQKYKLFQLLNKEISIDVDASRLPCGLNAAVYLVDMIPNSLEHLGVGYGDAQCPTDIKFLPEPNLKRAESCAVEIDLIETNREAMAWTMHPCQHGVCDKAGADMNSFRQDVRDFFGPGKKVDTTKAFTVKTRFVGDPLLRIERSYVSNGVELEHPAGPMTEASVAAQKAAWHEPNVFMDLGGFSSLTESLRRGMTLVLSIWDDPATNMAWLDEGDRGPCSRSDKENLRARAASSLVRFSNLQVRDLQLDKAEL